MEKLSLEVITPSGKVFGEEVISVTLPGSEGEFGVLPGHASLVSLLSSGVIDIDHGNGRVESIAVDWGYAEVGEDKVTVLVDDAVAIKGETEGDVAKALDAAKQLLREAQDSKMLLSAVEAKIEATARGLL